MYKNQWQQDGMVTINPEKYRECKAILFDFGGTLDSDGEHWLDRFYALYCEAKIFIPTSEIKLAFYHADKVCCNDPHVLSLGLRPLMKFHVHLQFKLLNRIDPVKEHALADAFCAKTEYFLRRNVELLASLRDFFRLGVVSNFYGNVDTICEEAGLAHYLDVILDSVKLGVSKPNPDIFQTAVKRLNLNPAEVIFVGDSYEHDMIPAGELGMKTFWLKGPLPRIPDKAPPVDEVITSLTALKELII